ncbi:MAG: diacylglycerol kinase family lipid kinase [Anaerolineae bacterium]|jgi:diacylglycerol kinase (ATP)
MATTTVILNPTAGRGAGARLSSQIGERLRSYGLEFELSTTSAPGDATVLAREAAAQGGEAVIAVGGDGTTNEVLNGLMQATQDANGTALGVVPIGTGNDFAFGAGVPLILKEACQAVARGQSRVLDVGRMRADNEEPRYFLNGVGMGFDAQANIESRKIKRLRGTLLYVVAVLRTLAFYYHSPLITMRVDGVELVQPSLLISVMNGRRMGGGFYITPSSEMDDGLFDFCVAAQVSRPKMVAFVPRFMRGTHTTDVDITMGQGREVTVVSESPWVAHLDGEIYGVGARRYEIELLPQRMRLIC